MPKHIQPVAAQVEEVDRMLAGYVVNDADGQAWFFKVAGPKDAVAGIEPEFREVMKSVQFSGMTAQWKTPENWIERPGDNPLRYATLNIPGDVPLELTISHLPYDEGESAGQFAFKNVNRWRGQLSLPPLDVVGIEQEIERFTVDGKQAALVNLVGELKNTGPPFASMMNGGRPTNPAAPSDQVAGLPEGHPPVTGPVQGPAPPPVQGPALPPGSRPVGPPSAGPPTAGPSVSKYEMPEGWKIAAENKPFSILTLEAADGDESVTVTVSPIGGGTSANVDRWRGKVGLGPPTPDELESMIKPIELDGAKADYVTVTSSPSNSAPTTILGVVATVRGTPWVVYLSGDAPLAERERSRFEAFVKSLRFE